MEVTAPKPTHTSAWHKISPTSWRLSFLFEPEAMTHSHRTNPTMTIRVDGEFTDEGDPRFDWERDYDGQGSGEQYLNLADAKEAAQDALVRVCREIGLKVEI